MSAEDEDRQIEIYQTCTEMARYALRARAKGDLVRAFALLGNVQQLAATAQNLIRDDATQQGVTLTAAHSRP